MPRKHRRTGKKRTGRPPDETKPLQRIHWVDWVEACAKEYKENGSTKPYVDVLLDLLRMTGGPLTAEEQAAVTTDAEAAAREIIADEKRFTRIEHRFKKKRIAARHELRGLLRWRVIRRGWLRARRERQT